MCTLSRFGNEIKSNQSEYLYCCSLSNYTLNKKRLMESSRIPGITQENLRLTFLPHSTDEHQKTSQQTFVLVKTSRRLQCNIFLSSKTSWRHNCKTSCKHVLKTSWRRLGDLLKTYWRRLEDVLGRRIANVLEDEKCYTEDVLKTSWKTRNVCWDSSKMKKYIFSQMLGSLSC